MAKKIDQLTVFVSSPGGLKQDRAAVQAAVEEANKVLSSEGIALSTFLWERDAVPGRAPEYGQQILNKKVQDETDILLVMVHDRIGGATPVAESGTVEEFDIAHEIAETGARKLEICVYFKIAPVSPLSDLTQLEKVQRFRSRVHALPYLTRDYEREADLQFGLVSNLVEMARRIVLPEGDVQAAVVKGKRGLPVAPAPSVFEGASSVELELEDETLGPLDLEAIATSSIQEVSPLFQTMTALTANFSQTIRTESDKLGQATELVKKGIAIDKKAMVDSFAEKFKEHAEDILPVISQLEESMGLGASSSLSMIQEWIVEGEEAEIAFEETLDVIENSNQAFSDLSDIIGKSIVSIQQIPGLTIEFKKSKRRVIAAYNRLRSLLDSNSQTFSEAVRVGRERLSAYRSGRGLR